MLTLFWAPSKILTLRELKNDLNGEVGQRTCPGVTHGHSVHRRPLLFA